MRMQTLAALIFTRTPRHAVTHRVGDLELQTKVREDFTITTSTFTVKTLLRHNAKLASEHGE